MTDDLIKRLRAMAATGWHPIGAEAADAIDRLRAAVQHEADCVEAAKAEIDRLTRERDAQIEQEKANGSR